MNRAVSRTLIWALAFLCLVPLVHAANRPNELPPRYKHWLTEEVNYIIDSNERKQFLALTSDPQRDAFIDAFWQVRNPDPGSETNSYKDEHYRRLAYANEHYGSIKRQDGWRSDMGRMYIVLGPPKQVVTYLSARNVRPMQIWFYQSPSLALPPYFNLIFYKRSIGEDFSLYSPISDGPARLVATLEAMNDQKRSLDILRKSLGTEVAKTSVSLIPAESVNLDQYDPGMSSDLMLNMIQGLPDNPITQERLSLNRAREHVTMSLIVGGQDATMGYTAVRDAQGRDVVHYLLRSAFPDSRIVGTRKDGSLYYDFMLRSNVLTTDNKPIYEQDDEITGNLSEPLAVAAKKKNFAAEARLPLVPGKYIVVATLTNKVNSVAIRQHLAVTVPETKGQPIALSNLLAYAGPPTVQDRRSETPFNISGLRFAPLGAQTAFIHEGEKLPLVFQMWLDPKTSATASPEKIHLRYVFGSIAASRDEATQETEEVDAGNRDQAGNLLTGHTLDTSNLVPGNYKVVVSATRDGEQKPAYASLNLRVMPSDYSGTWSGYGPANPGGEMVDDLKRGLAAEAQGADTEALAEYSRAIAAGPSDLRPFDGLASFLIRKGMTDQLAALSQQPILTKTAVNPSTLLAIANALSQKGNPKEVVRMLEAQLALQPPSAELYNALADSCIASGDTNRAKDFRALATKLKK